MKNGISITLFALLTTALGYLYLSVDDRDEEWQKKIDRNKFVTDSLSKVVDEMEKRLYEKDSILLGYMQTLNKSLYELDKEAAKDKTVLNQNEEQQANMLKAFCENMTDLHKPEFCN